MQSLDFRNFDIKTIFGVKFFRNIQSHWLKKDCDIVLRLINPRCMWGKETLK